MSSFDEIKKTVFAAVGETPEARRALLACDEALTNIVRYSGAKALMFSCQKQGEELLVSFLDDGIPFDPLARDNPDTESSLEEREIGGLGIFIVKQLSEVVEYSRVDDKNHLIVIVSIMNKNNNNKE